jgi:hypothetical protein
MPGFGKSSGSTIFSKTPSHRIKQCNGFETHSTYLRTVYSQNRSNY